MDSEFKRAPDEMVANDVSKVQKITILEADAKETEPDCRVISVADDGTIEVKDVRGKTKNITGEHILEVGNWLKDKKIKLVGQSGVGEWVVKECLVVGGVMVGSETAGEQPTKIISWQELIQNNPELVGEIREFLEIDSRAEASEQ